MQNAFYYHRVPKLADTPHPPEVIGTQTSYNFLRMMTHPKRNANLLTVQSKIPVTKISCTVRTNVA